MMQNQNIAENIQDQETMLKKPDAKGLNNLKVIFILCSST